MIGYDNKLVQAMTSPQANQIKQISQEEYGQAQADMQKSKRLQAMAEALAGKQYGASQADVIAALVDGFARAKAMKQSDEKWSSAYERAMQYEQQEKERAEAKAKAELEAKWARDDQSWRERQEYAANQDATRTNADREYQAGVTADNRKYAEGQASAAHQRAMEMAAVKSQQQKPLTPNESIKIADAQAGLAATQQMIEQFERMLYTTDKNGNMAINPDFAGAVGVIDQFTAPIGAWFGSDQGKANKQAERASTTMVLQAASNLKGTLSDRDVELLQASAPKPSDNAEIWHDWYQNEFKPMVLARAQALQAGISPYSQGREVPGQAMQPGTELPAPQVFQSGKYQIEVR